MAQVENITSSNFSSSEIRKNICMIEYINASLEFTAYLCILLPVSCLLMRSCNEHMNSVSYYWDGMTEWKQSEKLQNSNQTTLKSEYLGFIQETVVIMQIGVN